MAIKVTVLLRCLGIFIAMYRNQSYFTRPPAVPTIEEARHVGEKIVRVVDNYELINDKEGVPIEYWYNESLPDSQYQSAPGCPQSIEGLPWVYFGSRCFLVSFMGPCERGELVALQPGSLHGVCACQCFLENSEYQMRLSNESGRYTECIDSDSITCLPKWNYEDGRWVQLDKNCLCIQLQQERKSILPRWHGKCPTGQRHSRILRRCIYHGKFRNRLIG